MEFEAAFAKADVNPARAGMILAGQGPGPAGPGKPRASGDDPKRTKRATRARR